MLRYILVYLKPTKVCRNAKTCGVIQSNIMGKNIYLINIEALISRHRLYFLPKKCVLVDAHICQICAQRLHKVFAIFLN